MQVLGFLAVWKIGWWTARRAIHSIWIVSSPALGAEWRWDKLSMSTVSVTQLWVSPCSFRPPVDSQIAHKIPDFQYPLSTESGMLRDIHSIWIVSKPALGTEWRWETFFTVSACHLLVSPCIFSPRLALKLHTKYQIFNTLLVQKMGWYATTRDIHCSWSIWRPALDA